MSKPIRLFIDTEFDTNASGAPTKVLSVGITTIHQPTKTLYAEFVHPDDPVESAFVEEYVLPIFDGTSAYMSKAEFGNAFTTFIETLGITDQAVEVIADTDIDIRFFNELVGSRLAYTPVILDLSDYTVAETFEEAYESHFDPIIMPKHHALHDAFAVRRGWIAIQGL